MRSTSVIIRAPKKAERVHHDPRRRSRSKGVQAVYVREVALSKNESRGGMQVVICGGGVIGVCTAYFLGRLGSEVIVVETAEVAAAASSTAGGSPALK